MLTSVSILRRGYWAFDRAWLPPDEFEERVRALQAVARGAALAAVVVFGDADDYADSAWLSGMPDGTTVIVPVDRDPVLLGVNMWRELPFLRTLTWIADFRVSDGYASPAAALAATLESLALARRAVGVVGLERVLSPSLRRAALAGLQGCDARSFNTELLALRTPARPREVALVTDLARVVERALAAGRATFDSGGSNTDAYIAAERAARYDRVRDFRGLVNACADDLRPYEGRSSERTTPLALYVAVERQGYWADGVTSYGAAAAAAVDAMTAMARSGVTVGHVAAAALERLPSEMHDCALAYGLGNGIGLGLDEEPRIAPGSDESLVEGTLLSLRVLGKERAAALVQVGADRGRRLA